MSTNTMKRTEQWALLSLLDRHFKSNLTSVAADMLHLADASIGDLVELHEAGLVRVMRLDKSSPAPLGVADLNATQLAHARVTLSPEGKKWCANDPCNRVMCAMAYGGRNWPLNVAVARHELDLAAVAACVRADLVWVTDAETGSQITPCTEQAFAAAMAARPEQTLLALGPAGGPLVYP